jgi:pilus assembly protein CpaE
LASVSTARWDEVDSRPGDEPRDGRRGGRTVVRRPDGSATRVLIGINDLALQDEVLDFLERDPRFEVVGAAGRLDSLLRLASSHEADATVACPNVARDIRHPAASGRLPGLLMVAEELTVPVLREAIDAGASGVFAWPDERDELARSIMAARRPNDEMPLDRGHVVAILGSRGGAGTTFVATHLAAALAARRRRCVVVDLDVTYADVTVALGIRSPDQVRTMADLVPVADELSPEHVQDALVRHEAGFDVLLAPPDPEESTDVSPGLYRAAIALLAGNHDDVILHAPRALDDVTRAGIAMADEVLLIVTPDLFSLYGARRAVASLGLGSAPGRCRVVMNPAGRAALGAREVERVLGLVPLAGVRYDPAVARAQDRGELLSPRSRRAGKDVRALARLVSERVGRPGRPDEPTVGR